MEVVLVGVVAEIRGTVMLWHGGPLGQMTHNKSKSLLGQVASSLDNTCVCQRSSSACACTAQLVTRCLNVWALWWLRQLSNLQALVQLQLLRQQWPEADR